MTMIIESRDFRDCPICGSSKFVVSSIISSRYFVDRRIDEISCKYHHNDSVGLCATCGNRFKMIENNMGFTPISPLRELMWDMDNIVEQ